MGGRLPGSVAYRPGPPPSKHYGKLPNGVVIILVGQADGGLEH